MSVCVCWGDGTAEEVGWGRVSSSAWRGGALGKDREQL